MREDNVKKQEKKSKKNVCIFKKYFSSFSHVTLCEVHKDFFDNNEKNTYPLNRDFTTTTTNKK